MRLSIQTDDPGYSREALEYEALLDGEPVLAVTADEELGLVVEWIRGADGRPSLTPRGEPVLRERRGRVELRRLRA